MICLLIDSKNLRKKLKNRSFLDMSFCEFSVWSKVLTRSQNFERKKEKIRSWECLRELGWYPCGMDSFVAWLFIFWFQLLLTFSLWLSYSKILSLPLLQVVICQELPFYSLLHFWYLSGYQNFMITTMGFPSSTTFQWYGTLTGSYSHWPPWYFSLDGLCYLWWEMVPNGKKLNRCLRIVTDTGGQICFFSITWFLGLQRL